MKESKTIFCDIDGCLIKHQNSYHKNDMKILDGTVEKIKEWDRKGYNLILTTGRRESARKITEEQLEKNGVTYDLLIMGLGPGVRVLINDVNPDFKNNTATSINLNRNAGIKGVNI